MKSLAAFLFFVAFSFTLHAEEKPMGQEEAAMSDPPNVPPALMRKDSAVSVVNIQVSQPH